MLTACFTSALFLISYLTYHYHVGSKPFTGQGSIRLVYFTILISHTILAAVIVPLVLLTLTRAWKAQWSSPPTPGTLDLAALALRLRDRCGHLSHALSALSCLLKSSQDSYGRAEGPRNVPHPR